MSQKSAAIAFMSPQAAIAKGRENSKGWKKNPMKLIYNFDAHKKTASEGMFSNPSSEIPDDLWRAPAPMQRQVDAAVLWAELTGKHASFDGVKAFGQTLMLNPRSDDLEKAFKHYEKKTGKSRNKMSQRDIYNSLRATGMGKKASAEKLALDPVTGMTAAGIAAVPLALYAGSKMMKKKKNPLKIASSPTLKDRFRGMKLSLTSTPIRKAPPEAMAIAAAGRRRSPTAKYMTYKGTTYKIASSEKTARNETAVRLLHAINDNRVAAGAIAGTPVGMGKAYLDYRPQESGISNAEARIVGRLAELKARGGASKSEIDSLKKDMVRARDRRENLARTVAFGGATGGAMGAGLGALSKYRRAAAKARK